MQPRCLLGQGYHCDHPPPPEHLLCAGPGGMGEEAAAGTAPKMPGASGARRGSWSPSWAFPAGSLRGPGGVGVGPGRGLEGTQASICFPWLPGTRRELGGLSKLSLHPQSPRGLTHSGCPRLPSTQPLTGMKRERRTLLGPSGFSCSPQVADSRGSEMWWDLPRAT